MEQFDWFRPEDLPFLFKALSQSKSPTVLVGGQSLTFWVDYYQIDIPDTESPYLTQDADIFGTALDAIIVCKALGGHLEIPDASDSTANTALITFNTSDGRSLLIDFMGRLIGLNEKEIISTSIKLTDEEFGEINVLNPKLVLCSRLANLKALPSKRDGNGVAQARVAIDVCKQYFIEESLALDEDKQEDYLMNSARWLAKLAQSAKALYVFKNWGIDVLTAAPIELIKHTKFHSLDWPKQVEWVTEKRKPNKPLSKKTYAKPRTK